jgi:hypothetical protein
MSAAAKAAAFFLYKKERGTLRVPLMTLIRRPRYPVAGAL